jgi:CxxC motif-containing protein (DUF1111 family)
MSRLSYGICYLVIAAAVLVPVGLRALTRPPARQHILDTETVSAGRALFEHQWKPDDPLSPEGDGLGPVFNANSCLACHHQGGVGGSGGLQVNVTTFTVQATGGTRHEGVVHASATSSRYQETLRHLDPTFPATSRPTLDLLDQLDPNRNSSESVCHVTFVPVQASRIHLSQRNTPALFGAKEIDEIPDRVLIAEERAQRIRWGMPPVSDEKLPAGRALRLADGRVGHFGWKAQAASLGDFVRAACANELGLGNPGQAQPRPLGSNYAARGLDLTDQQCNQITTFIASLPRPRERLPEDSAARERVLAGKELFTKVGCADCHKPDLGPVTGLYSDLLLHSMGSPLQGGGSYNEPIPEQPNDPHDPTKGPSPTEWRTPPLWGVADSAPYLHDGRAPTLEAAIQAHGGQAAGSVRHFSKLRPAEQADLRAFLESLRAS